MKPYLFIIFMSSADVLRIHEMVINEFGGRGGIHSLGLLDSAVYHPWMIIEFGTDEEQRIHNLAAAYFFHIIKNHPFIDGNKRTGLLTSIEFMYINGYELDGEFDDLYQLAVETAASHVKEAEIAAFFKKVIKKI